jgi:hypothetical protein
MRFAPPSSLGPADGLLASPVGKGAPKWQRRPAAWASRQQIGCGSNRPSLGPADGLSASPVGKGAPKWQRHPAALAPLSASPLRNGCDLNRLRLCRSLGPADGELASLPRNRRDGRNSCYLGASHPWRSGVRPGITCGADVVRTAAVRQEPRPTDVTVIQKVTDESTAEVKSCCLGRKHRHP